MKSKLRLVLQYRSILLSIALAAPLSACGPRISLTQGALPCGQMVEASGLLQPTPGAALPANSSAGEWVSFGDREAGQLDKANADKVGVRGILATCEDWQAKAAAIAKRKKVLAIF